MKLFSAVFLAAFVTVALTQDNTTTPKPASSTTVSPTPTPPPPPPPTTSTQPPTTTAAPTTQAPTTRAPTTETPTTTPAPKPEPTATLSNYTLLNAEKKVCAVVLMKVIVAQNASSYPFVNGTLVEKDSECSDTKVILWIQSVDGYKLEMVIEHDTTNFYVGQLSAQAGGLIASRDNLTQFSTPMKQFYKCSSASQVALEENDVKIVFSEMKYQAFQKAETADFVGTQLECVSDYHSDVVIIAIGCALALLVVVILVAYLIARRKNRQRGYQSV